MSAQPCRVCGAMRKCYQSYAEDGWHQPACHACGDPGYVEPFDDDDAAPPECGHVAVTEQGRRRCTLPRHGKEARHAYGEEPVDG